MKLHYYPDTDSLYVEFSTKDGTDTKEITNDLIADFDKDGSLVGLDIQHASQNLDLQTLETVALPVIKTQMTAHA